MTAPHQGTTLLGAEGARELTALLTGSGSGTAVVERIPHPGAPPLRVVFRRPDAPPPDTAPPAAAAEPSWLLDRHVLRLAPAPAVPRPGTVPDLFPPGTAVLAGTPSGTAGGRTLPLDDTLEETVHRLRPRHIRAVVELHGEDAVPSESLLALHDALFRTAKACAALPTPPESFVVVVLGGISAGRVPHACSGLFTGFVKSLALEWPGTSVLAVVHESRDLASAGPDAARETVTDQSLPAVWYAGEPGCCGRRWPIRARPPAPPPPPCVRWWRRAGRGASARRCCWPWPAVTGPGCTSSDPPGPTPRSPTRTWSARSSSGRAPPDRGVSPCVRRPWRTTGWGRHARCARTSPRCATCAARTG
nr:hypothetical protein [Streptomyces tendae]